MAKDNAYFMPSFTLPKGVEIPENLQEGEAFQTMATILLGKGGKVELIEIDGMVIPGYEKKSKGKKMANRGEGEMEEEERVEEGGNGRGGGFIAEVMQRGIRLPFSLDVQRSPFGTACLHQSSSPDFPHNILWP